MCTCSELNTPSVEFCFINEWCLIIAGDQVAVGMQFVSVGVKLVKSIHIVVMAVELHAFFL